MHVAGARGYEVDSDALARRYEQVDPRGKYAVAFHLLPQSPSAVMDVGSGSGVDAAWFASLGHEVLAVEPVDALRLRAMSLHPLSLIRWIDDCLPHLSSVAALGKRFQLIVVSGVWTHLEEEERHDALSTMATLLAPDGIILISIRHGPAPEGRRSFPAEPPGTVAFAEEIGLKTVLDVQAPSMQAANREAGVTWTWLAFRG